MSVYVKDMMCQNQYVMWTKPSKNGEYLCNEKKTELLVGWRMDRENGWRMGWRMDRQYKLEQNKFVKNADFFGRFLTKIKCKRISVQMLVDSPNLICSY